MPREIDTDAVVDAVSAVCDDTSYSQEASMLAWRYVAEFATMRANDIEREMGEQ